jgi:pilus assembly protein CpaB
MLALAALTTAGITAFLVSGWMERQRAQINVKAPEAPKAKILEVLVAKRNLGTGTFLKPGDITWQAWPAGSLQSAYAVQGKRKIKEFVGSVVRSSIVAGQPVTDASVVKVGERGFLAAVLSPGMRAVSFPITAASGIAGLVFPGDRVDLILSHKIKTATAGKSGSKIRIASETVLTNVRILAIDQRTDDQKGKKSKKSSVGKTATLEVTPKQAEMISVALNLGKLSLSLRSLARKGVNPGAKEPTSSRGKTVTMDGEVSRLLNIRDYNNSVTILRGSGSETGAVQEKGKK